MGAAPVLLVDRALTASLTKRDRGSSGLDKAGCANRFGAKPTFAIERTETNDGLTVLCWTQRFRNNPQIPGALIRLLTDREQSWLSASLADSTTRRQVSRQEVNGGQS